MREWRKTHPLTAAQKRKSTARAYANVYLARGKIVRQPCPCVEAKAEMQHTDYEKPLAITWKCRACRFEQARTERKAA
jgi:hypothetical protein